MVVPDTPTASAAVALIQQWAPPALIMHSHRSFVFGSLLGARDGMTWDAEVLFVAAMLHDAGLTGHLPRDRPFPEVGGIHARDFCLGEGFTPARAELAARAVALHMEIGVATKDRPEVALMHLGAAADVTGMRLEDIAPPVVERIVEHFPRQDFKHTFITLINDEARRHPNSSTAFLCHWGQLRRRIRRAPYSS